jgi:hypothetical protein
MLVLVPLLAGCTGGGGRSTPSSAPPIPSGPEATVSAVPSSRGSPPASTWPQSTEDRLHRALSAGAPWQVAATLQGTIGTKGTVTGDLAARADDLSLALVTTFGAEATLIREVVVGGSSYVRYKDQAWQLVPQDAAHPRPASLRSALMTVRCTEPEPGTLSITGEDAVTLAEALGMVDPGSADVGAEATMTLRPDGNPDQLRLRFDSDAGRWDLAYAFDKSASVTPIAAPDGVVAMWEQRAVFRLLYPVDWNVNPIGKAPKILDSFVSMDGIVDVWCEPTNLSLKEWTVDGVRAYSGRWGAKPTDNRSVRYGSKSWNVTEWDKATLQGDRGTAMAAATVHGGLGCDVTVFVFSWGDREKLLGQFDRVVASFTFLN